MKLYKVLNEDMTSCNGGDATWKFGEWMPVIDGELLPCVNGYHLCRREDLVEWLGEAIYEAEYRGEMVKSDNKVVVREARIIRKLDNWNDRTARLFVCDCAEQSLQYYENEFPDDKRPRESIEVSRKFANGEATKEELAAAWAAASAAAWAGARDAASVAAAWDAARDAASAAASVADWAAASVAARAAASAAQTKHLFEILQETGAEE